MKPVVIHGRGVAAVACAWLLAEKGHEITLRGVPVSSAPTVVLNEATVRLLDEGFCLPLGEYAAAHRIESRVVHWKGSSELARMAEFGVLIPGGVLAELLTEHLITQHRRRVAIIPESEPVERALPAGQGWTIFASGKRRTIMVSTPPPGRLTFGKRHALCVDVMLRSTADESAATFELTPKGWLFLAPTGRDTGMLLGVVPKEPPDLEGAVQALLAAGHLVRSLIGAVQGVPRGIPVAPSVLDPACGPGWIAAGEAAVSFDPLCGDGAGNALRTAVLAAAVIAAVEEGQPAALCLSHYRSRLMWAFLTHLRACEAFYSAPILEARWDGERAVTSRGVDFMSSRVVRDGFGQYMLERTSLVSTDR